MRILILFLFTFLLAKNRVCSILGHGTLIQHKKNLSFWYFFFSFLKIMQVKKNNFRAPLHSFVKSAWLLISKFTLFFHVFFLPSAFNISNLQICCKPLFLEGKGDESSEFPSNGVLFPRFVLSFPGYLDTFNKCDRESHLNSSIFQKKEIIGCYF